MTNVSYLCKLNINKTMQEMDPIKTTFAAKLLEVRAIKLQPSSPFTWASGWKSPFYCDNRKTLSYPRLRSFVKTELCHAIQANFPGLENLIEGNLEPGSKVVVVEDLVSTGGSSLKAVEAIRKNGCEVIGMVASYTYGFPVAEEAFKAAGVKLVTLTDYEHVVKHALEIGYIKPGDVDVIHEWRKDPANWNNQ